MSGLFDSMADVKFDEADSSKITHMYSPQREEVEMDYPVDTKGNIEVWLQRLVDGMKDTVCAIIKAANRNVYNQELEAFIFGHPAQIALLGIQFMWTADTQAALTNAKTDKSIMSKNMKKTDAVLKEMVTITVKTSLSSIQRTNLETCITVHMHQKESTEDLVKKKVKDPTDFEWLKQVLHWRLHNLELPCIFISVRGRTSRSLQSFCAVFLCSTSVDSPGGRTLSFENTRLHAVAVVEPMCIVVIMWAMFMHFLVFIPSGTTPVHD